MTLCDIQALRQADSCCSEGHSMAGALLPLHEPDAG
jgi:hypothetical protein